MFWDALLCGLIASIVSAKIAWFLRPRIYFENSKKENV